MLTICGNSFSYGTDTSTWPKILANKLSMPLTNLSLVGGSNYSICFQIDYALKNIDSKIIIVNLSPVDRFELDEDEEGLPVNIEDFNYYVDKIKESPFKKEPTIVSGNIISHLRNYHIKKIKNQLLTHSHRLQAQYQSWCLQNLISQIKCKHLIYRTIFPVYHQDIKNYKNEYFYGIDSMSNWKNTGAYDFEIVKAKTVNHLSTEENLKFAEYVFNGL